MTDPDDALVAAWDKFRAIEIAGKDDPEKYEDEIARLDELILETPAHGIRGIAVKAGYALWTLSGRDDVCGNFGYRAVDNDRDWGIRVAGRLAAELELMTGIVVNPRWGTEVYA